MPISTVIDQENKLTIFTAEGNSTFEEFMVALKSFYDGDPTLNVLWNLEQSAVWDLSGHQIKKLAQYAPRFDKSRDRAKAAIVVSDELSTAISKLFVLFGQSNELKMKIKIFKTLHDAFAWIKAD